MVQLSPSHAETKTQGVVSRQLAEQLSEILGTHDRVAIAGGSGVGKTTMAESITDRRVFFAKEFESFSHDAVPHAMLAAVQNWTRFAIEGVMVARMLRKAAQLGKPPPVDAVIYLHQPHRQRKPGQITQAKGIHTVFTQWRALDRVTPVYVVG